MELGRSIRRVFMLILRVRRWPRTVYRSARTWRRMRWPAAHLGVRDRPSGAGGASPQILGDRPSGAGGASPQILGDRPSGAGGASPQIPGDRPSGAGGASPQIPVILPSRRSGTVILEFVGVTKHGGLEGFAAAVVGGPRARTLAPGVGCVCGPGSSRSASGALALSGKPGCGFLFPQRFSARFR